MKSGFLNKLLERLNRVRPEDVKDFLLRLADENGFLETIFNAIHEGVIVTDPVGTITFLNRAACEFFGFQEEDCIGRHLNDRLRGLDWETVADQDRSIIREMEVFYPQNRFLNFYVAPLRFSAPTRHSSREARDRKGEPELVGYAVILRDVTEHRRSAEETLQSEKINALTLLAAGVAHEIGNPLNSLHIHLQLMERRIRRLPEGLREGLLGEVGVAKEETSRLDAIIRQFLGAIRPARLETHPENVQALVEETIAFLRPEIEDRNLLVEMHLRPDFPLLEVDRTQMKQAFFNLIKNSFQAMKTGGFLRIDCDFDDEFAWVTFADNGGGIPPDQMSKVFEPYHTTKVSGSGLGLLIVRRIVREHGGEMELLNDEGKGLSVTIRLPRMDRRVKMLAAPEEHPLKNSAPAP
jgi:PAS domain S-box-containing protein